MILSSSLNEESKDEVFTAFNPLRTCDGGPAFSQSDPNTLEAWAIKVRAGAIPFTRAPRRKAHRPNSGLVTLSMGSSVYVT
jgi:hypothetical protein